MLTCPNCSTPLNGGVCPSCGYVDSSIFVLKPGTKLQKGKYTVGKVLGQGGFGITYRGANQLLKFTVAIKEFFPEGCSRAQDGKTVIPHPNIAADFPKWKHKFLQEAQTLAKLSHPSIVKVLDFFEENNTAYMVMEFLKGQTLESYIQSKGGRLSQEEALKLIKQIAEAVKYIHSHNILHRDLKPDNIILTDDGRLVLIDFGNAKDLSSSTQRTSSTTAVLTPGYGAPEQYSIKEQKGFYTDIYALGAILYRMLTGQVPVEADRRLREILNNGKDPLVTPRQLNPSISENVEKVILKALNLKKKDRYQSVDEFLRDLNGVFNSYKQPNFTSSQSSPDTTSNGFKPFVFPIFGSFILNVAIAVLLLYILDWLNLNFLPEGPLYHIGAIAGASLLSTFGALLSDKEFNNFLEFLSISVVINLVIWLIFAIVALGIIIVSFLIENWLIILIIITMILILSLIDSNKK